MNLPDEKREAVAEVLDAMLSEHAAARGAFDATCGTCAKGRNRALRLADALAPLLAGWLAEVWDAALGYVWELADPAWSVVMTQASKYVVVEADIIQAQRENPYRAALAADAPQNALPQGPRSDAQMQGGVVAHPSTEKPSEQYDSE